MAQSCWLSAPVWKSSDTMPVVLGPTTDHKNDVLTVLVPSDTKTVVL